MRRLLTVATIALLAAPLGQPALADPGVGLRLVEVATDKPLVKIAIRTVPGAAALALMQNGRELQRYAPPASTSEGLVAVRLQPGTGAVALAARAYGPQGRVLGESAPLRLDPQAFAPEPLAVAGGTNVVADNLSSMTISSLVPATAADGLPGAMVTVTVNGQGVYQAILPRHGHFSLPSIGLPLGKAELRIEQSNVWGRREAAAFKTYNLGEPVSVATYALVDKENYTLYWVRSGKLQAIYPIAIGRPRTQTPVGTFVMGKKEVMADPNSGWGVLRMLIYDVGPDGYRHWRGYAIHGTDQPSSIGKEASHGCVRMFNEDVVKLSREMPLETRVIIRDRLKVYIDEL
jgi:hypothetical protein